MQTKLTLFGLTKWHETYFRPISMFGKYVPEMSRKRVLLIWAIIFTLVLLIYVYLPYSFGNIANKSSEIQGLIAPIDKDASQIQLQEYIRILTESFHGTTTTIPTTVVVKPKICSLDQSLLVGTVFVNQTVPQMKEVVEDLSVKYGGFVEKGGVSKPKDCIAKEKLAIIIPYRNRSEHLRIFLRHMHPIMERQKHDYRMVVIEQAGNNSFNRATLLNIGFLEALKIADFNCFVFHDVDHILQNDRNDYSCPESPKLLGVSVDRFHRRFPYLHYFGGVGAFSKDQFEKINGYSNKYWGWGGEDDDAYNRVRAAGYHLGRPRADIGRYMMLTKHHMRDKAGPNRHELLKTSAKRMYQDGLNTVKYKLIEKTEYPLYTHIIAEISRELNETSSSMTTTTMKES